VWEGQTIDRTFGHPCQLDGNAREYHNDQHHSKRPFFIHGQLVAMTLSRSWKTYHRPKSHPTIQIFIAFEPFRPVTLHSKKKKSPTTTTSHHGTPRTSVNVFLLVHSPISNLYSAGNFPLGKTKQGIPHHLDTGWETKYTLYCQWLSKSIRSLGGGPAVYVVLTGSVPIPFKRSPGLRAR